jgi:hypothetical protein
MYALHKKEIKRDEVVTLERNPEILQSIGPGGKLFSAKFASLRFDEDVVFCEEHTFNNSITRCRTFIASSIYGKNVSARLSVTDPSRSL